LAVLPKHLPGRHPDPRPGVRQPVDAARPQLAVGHKDVIMQTPQRAPWSRLSAWTSHGVAVSYALLVLLIIAAIVYNPHFASWANARAQLQIASFIGIIAIGQTLVILTGQIDLSVP